jgi:hypothetical protein
MAPTCDPRRATSTGRWARRVGTRRDGGSRDRRPVRGTCGVAGSPPSTEEVQRLRGLGGLLRSRFDAAAAISHGCSKRWSSELSVARSSRRRCRDRHVAPWLVLARRSPSGAGPGIEEAFSRGCSTGAFLDDAAALTATAACSARRRRRRRSAGTCCSRSQNRRCAPPRGFSTSRRPPARPRAACSARRRSGSCDRIWNSRVSRPAPITESGQTPPALKGLRRAEASADEVAPRDRGLLGMDTPHLPLHVRPEEAASRRLRARRGENRSSPSHGACRRTRPRTRGADRPIPCLHRPTPKRSRDPTSPRSLPPASRAARRSARSHVATTSPSWSTRTSAHPSAVCRAAHDLDRQSAGRMNALSADLTRLVSHSATRRPRGWSPRCTG